MVENIKINYNFKRSINQYVKYFFLFQCTCNETFKEIFKLFEGGTFQTINSTTKLKLDIVLYVKLSFMLTSPVSSLKAVMCWFIDFLL